MEQKIQSIDEHLINFFKKIAPMSLHIAIAVIFIWFGALKVFDLSPATPLVEALHNSTFVASWDFKQFMMFFGLFEVLIGILFLIRGAERIVIPLLLIHMVTTIMPLFILPDTVWQSTFVPTLEGQYIIKNIVIIAAAIAIAGNLQPLKEKQMQ